MLNIVWSVIEFVVEMILRVIVYLILITMQFLTKELQALFLSDFSVMERYFPVVKNTTQIFTIIALTLIFLIFLWQVFRNFGAGVLGDCEDPIPLLIKTLLFTFLIFFSKQICSMLMEVTGLITTMFWDIDLEWEWAWSVGAIKDEWNSWSDSFDSSVHNADTLFSQNIISYNLSSLLGGVWSIVIEVIILIAICWNYLKLVLEIAERYVVMCILYMFSPLAFATGASNSTNSIFRGWCRMFASSLFMMVVNTWSLLLAMSSLQTFCAKGSVAGANFEYNVLSSDNKIVQGGTVTGNTLVWAVITFAFLKCAQSMDEYLNSMGLSTARTGRGLLEDAIAVTRTITQAVNSAKHMGMMKKFTNNAGGGKGSTSGAAGTTGTASGIKMSGSVNSAAKPTQQQLKNFSNVKNAAANKVGLSDKNIAGTKFDSKDALGRPTGIAPDGSKLTQLGGGAIMSEKNGVTSIKSSNGDLETKWADGSTEKFTAASNTLTSTSKDGNITSVTSANGTKVTTDNIAKTVTTQLPNGERHTDFMDGSAERTRGLVSSHSDPLSGNTTYNFEDSKGNERSVVMDGVEGPDEAMNAALRHSAMNSDNQNHNTASDIGGSVPIAETPEIPAPYEQPVNDISLEAATIGVGSALDMQNNDFANDGGNDGEVITHEPTPVPENYGESIVEKAPIATETSGTFDDSDYFEPAENIVDNGNIYVDGLTPENEGYAYQDTSSVENNYDVDNDSSETDNFDSEYKADVNTVFEDVPNEMSEIPDNKTGNDSVSDSTSSEDS